MTECLRADAVLEQMQISLRIDRYASSARRKVAIGLTEATAPIIRSLEKASEFADITVVGCSVKSTMFQCVPVDNPAAPTSQIQVARSLVRLLRAGEVNAIVRGNASAAIVMNELAGELGYDKILRVAAMRDVKGREFLFAPASVVEGNTMEERLWMAERMALLLEDMDIEPVIGIGCIGNRREWCDLIMQSLQEGSFIAEGLRTKGVRVDFVGYNLETSLDRCNILVPANGMIGNAVWRMLTGVGGCKDLGDLGLIKEVFVDDSQYWDDYYDAIKFAVAISNMREDRRAVASNVGAGDLT